MAYFYKNMNSRKQLLLRIPTSPNQRRTEVIQRVNSAFLSPVFRQISYNPKSPLANYSSITNLPFRATNKITSVSTVHQDPPLKAKQLRSVNQSLAAKPPTINNCNIKTAHISFQNLQTLVSETQQQLDISNKQNNNKQRCLMSTMAPQHSVIKAKVIQKIQSQKQLFEEINYRMAQSNFMASMPQQIKVQQSIIEDREILQNFVLCHQVSKDQYVAIEQNVGICLVLKIQKLQNMIQNTIQMNQTQSVSHPTLVNSYQSVVNNNTEYIVLKQFFEQYFSVRPTKYKKQTLILFIKQLVDLFQFLQRRHLEYRGNIFQELVVCHSSCKLNASSNIHKCKSGKRPSSYHYLSFSKDDCFKKQLRSLMRGLSETLSFKHIKQHSFFQE